MENYKHFTDAQLYAELDKCIYCADKPCLEACPAHCSPADFIMSARLQTPADFGRAAAEILSRNPMGHTCGIVCPDTFCVDACSRKEFDCAVNIPKIQAAVLERARRFKTLPTPAKPPLNGKKVAIVGAGPAGLAATALLARKGYEIDLYDEEKKAGGACLQIPELRLPKKALQGDVDYILSLGEIRTHFGKKIDLSKIKADAVLVAAGQPDMSTLGIPGEALAVSSIQYLKAPSRFRGKKRVAVVGGGAVAADCAVTARLQGAEGVELFVRRTFGEMPLTAFEREMLIQHRIDISTRTRLKSIKRSGKTLTLTTLKTEAITKGKKTVITVIQDIKKSEVTRPGFDLVVLAIGSTFEDHQGNKKGIFYAGDCLHGASTVVEASASGKNAAAEIDLFLMDNISRDTTAVLKEAFKKARAPGSRSPNKSRLAVPDIAVNPVDLSCDFFGIRIKSPFLLSAAPATDGFEQMKKAYEAGWAGGVMKTAFDNLPIHIPAAYMFTFNESHGSAKTHGNADNVSDHPLDRVCGELKELRRLYPDRLTMASTGGPVTGDDRADALVWQSNTRKLEEAGALAVEYSLSCPQGGDGTEGAIVSQSARTSAKVVDWVMQTSQPDIPKLFKLSAAVTSIKPILTAILEVFARYPEKKAGVTLANSFPVMGFRDPLPSDTQPAQPKRWQEGVLVGMSGEGVLPISYLTLAEASSTGITISGNGGIMDYRAAANFLALGCKTVQVCTVVTHFGLGIIDELESGLSHLLKDYGLNSVQELIGIALPNPITPFPDLPAKKQISQVNPSLCENCGNCTRCPYMAISLNKNKIPVMDASRCIGCTICVKQCFAGALTMRERTPAELEALHD